MIELIDAARVVLHSMDAPSTHHVLRDTPLAWKNNVKELSSYPNRHVWSICILNIQSQCRNMKSISPISNPPRNLVYILSSGQASKQAGPFLACLLANFGFGGLLACLIT